jgi:hypothetical protein
MTGDSQVKKQQLCAKLVEIGQCMAECFWLSQAITHDSES